MIVCGDDALAERQAAELTTVYGERVTLVVPPEHRNGSATPRVGAAALLSRVQAAVPRGESSPTDETPPPVARSRSLLDEAILAAVGVRDAAVLALGHDDEANIHAALAARRLNPRLPLVIRLYNRRLGQHLEELLDQADGLLLRAVERTPPGHGQVANPGLCTLALLSSTTNDPAEAEGSDAEGRVGAKAAACRSWWRTRTPVKRLPRCLYGPTCGGCSHRVPVASAHGLFRNLRRARDCHGHRHFTEGCAGSAVSAG